MMGLNAYKQQAVVTDDPNILILKLYEGLVRFLAQVKIAIENDNIQDKFNNINRCIDIFDELRTSLNMDGGDIAYYLDGLYMFQIEMLFEVGVSNDISKIDQIIKVANGLSDAWKDEMKK
jgi:flagellar secretion chaperone FliS